MAKFVTIGERLSTTAPAVNKAFTERDPEPIIKRAKQQLDAGATYLDVNIGPAEYEKMAYEVARHHHEKWNGRGYPDGLSQKEIPLSARIMAVADVFDAVSAKRCYRDALPLEECFRIIENGSGQDFDPVIAGCFLT